MSYFIGPVPKKKLFFFFFWNSAESGFWSYCCLGRCIGRNCYCVLHLNIRPRMVSSYAKNLWHSFRSKVICVCLNKFISLKDGCIHFLCRFSQATKNCKLEILPNELRQEIFLSFLYKIKKIWVMSFDTNKGPAPPVLQLPPPLGSENIKV